MDVSIHDWSVQKLGGGFRNASLNASMVVDAQAQAQWNLGLDKTLPIVGNTYLVNFKIGVVPFMLWFDVPLHVTGSLEFDTAAELTVGTRASIALGDAYVLWDPTNHWTHAKPNPVMELAPHLTTNVSASLSATAQFGLTPSFHMQFDRVFQYTLTAAGSIEADVEGTLAEKEVCLTTDYDLEVTAETECQININLIDFHKDWVWGPTTLYSKSGVVVPKKCVPIA